MGGKWRKGERDTGRRVGVCGIVGKEGEEVTVRGEVAEGGDKEGGGVHSRPIHSR